LLKQDHRSAKLSYSFSCSGTKILVNLNFFLLQVKGSRLLLFRAEYYGLLRRIAARSNQGRNDGGRAGTVSRALNHYEYEGTE